MADNIKTLLLGDLSSSKRAVRLEGVGDVHVLPGLEAHVGAVHLTNARLDGTAIDDNSGAVVTSCCHDATRHVLVASNICRQYVKGEDIIEPSYPGIWMLPS